MNLVERGAALILALALAGCGGGGSSSRGPELVVTTTSLPITALLGGGSSDGVSFTVRNSGDESLDYQAIADASWITLSPARGALSAGASAIIVVRISCQEAGARNGAITVTGAGQSVRISVPSRCEAPPIAIEIVESPPQGEGEPRQAARAVLRWRISSTWPEQPAIGYSITTNHDQIDATPVTGNVGLDDVVTIDLRADCLDQGALDTDITVTAGELITTVPWGVRCRAGNAALIALEYYQGPLMWTWDSATRQKQSHGISIAGRRVAMVARVAHESPTTPLLAVSIHDLADEILAARLGQLLTPETIFIDDAAANSWETAYVFDLPGNLYRPGHEAVYTVDPDETLDETDEGDNVDRVSLDGRTPPPFKITFLPIRSSVGEPPALDPEAYMVRVHDYFPIADDYRARVGEPHDYQGEWDNLAAALSLLDRWNAEAEVGEYYHGIFKYPFDGSSCGYAWFQAPVAISGALNDGCTANIYAHEIGHNFTLLHAPGGCGAENTDSNYPYQFAGIGPHRGWWFSEGIFVNPRDGYFDTMSYCEPNFISDYNYRLVTNHRLAQSVAAASSGLTDQAAASDSPPLDIGAETASIALTGTVDANGNWALYSARNSVRASRTPPPGGAFSIALLDAGGREIHREPLTVHPGSDGGGAAWAARLPIPVSPAKYLVIRDRGHNVILYQELDADNRR